MRNRTTNQDLNSAIKRINQLIPQKTFDWYKTATHYYMATDRGERRHISARTKRELYDQLWAFIEGIEILRNSYKTI
jgi:hypothetical protein